MVHMKLGIGLGVWVLIWYDLGRLKLGKNCRKNPEIWVCEGVPRQGFFVPRPVVSVWCVPRHKDVVPRHKANFRE